MSAFLAASVFIPDINAKMHLIYDIQFIKILLFCSLLQVRV